MLPKVSNSTPLEVSLSISLVAISYFCNETQVAIREKWWPNNKNGLADLDTNG